MTVLEVESERADPRIDAWQDQVLSFFFTDSKKLFPNGAVDVAAVHEALTGLGYCPVADKNVLTMTVRRCWLQRAAAAWQRCMHGSCRLAAHATGPRG